MTTATLLNYAALVPPLINQPLSTVVLSAAFLNPSASAVYTTTTAGASFVMSGINKGQTFTSGAVGSLVQIQITTSAAYGTAVHVPFTIGGVQYSFSAVTAVNSSLPINQTALQISLTDANTINRSTSHTTNAVTIWDIDAAPVSVAVSIPNIYSAHVNKNGTNVGTATTAVLGDVLSVTLTTPATYGSNVQIPLFVGNVYDYFFCVTNSTNDVPTGFAFTNVTGAAFNTATTSAQVTVAGLDTNLPVTCSVSTGNTLLKNGAVVSSGSTTVVNGDKISVRLTSAASPNYDYTSYAIVYIGTTFQTYWSVTTRTSTDYWVIPSLEYKALYDVALGSGYTSVTLNQNNSLYRVDAASYSIASATPLYNPSPVADASTSTFLYATSYYEGLTYKISESAVVTAVVADPTGYHVYDECYAPKYNANAASLVTKRFIAISNGTTSIFRDTTGASPDVTLNTSGVIPYGMDSDMYGQNIYISMSNNTVAKLTLNTSTNNFSISKFISVGGTVTGGLRQVVIDQANKVWLLDVYNNLVLVINSVTDTVVKAISLPGSDPWDICVDGGLNAWVAGSYSNSLICISTTYVVTQVQCSGVPSCVAVSRYNGDVWVGHYGSNYIDVFNAVSLVMTHQINMGQPVTSLSYDDTSGYMWALCLYKNLATYQSRLSKITPITSAVSFTTVVDEPAGSLGTNWLKSNTSAPVAGLMRPVYVSIPPYPSYLFTHNTVQVSTGGVTAGALIANGDTFSLSMDKVSDYAFTTNTVPIQAGSSQSFTWSATTVRDYVPDAIYFDNLDNIAAGASATSGIATITGISVGAMISLTLDDPLWSIVLNGVTQAPNSTVTAKLNDTVQITGTLSANIGSASSKAVNVLVAIGATTVVPTVLGNFVVWSQVVDQKVPVILNAPGKFVPMYYMQSVRVPHISLTNSTAQFIQTVRHPGQKLASQSLTPSKGASASVALASSRVPSVRLTSEITLATRATGIRGYASTRTAVSSPSATSYVKPVIAFPILKEFQPGKPFSAYNANSVTGTTGGTVRAWFEIAPRLNFEHNKNRAGAEVDPAYTGRVNSVYREVEVRQYQQFPNTDYHFVDPVYTQFYRPTRIEVNPVYTQFYRPTRVEVDPYYTQFYRPTRIEVNPVYDVGTQPSQVLLPRDPYKFPHLHQELSGYDYIKGDTLGGKEAVWYQPSPRPRQSANYVTPVNTQVERARYSLHTYADVAYERSANDVGDSGGGPIDTQQHLYATPSLAIEAGRVAGFGVCTAYGFNTVVYTNGVPAYVKAYMYVSAVEVSSRNCMLDLPINKNVIPYKWYVQGG